MRRHAGLSRVRVAVALVAWALAGCASLAGLADGDAGLRDVAPRPAKDATKDAGGGVDATLDAERSDAGDAAPPVDARPTDGGDADAGGEHEAGEAASDAGVDVFCQLVAVEGGTAPACPAVDAAACAPRDIPDGGLAFHPPRTVAHACTPSQVTAYLGACLGTAATPDTCDAFVDADGGYRCASCLVSDLGAAEYGPLIITNDVGYLNVGGCIALAAPCNVSCAAFTQEAQLCPLLSCNAACGIDASSEQTDAAAACSAASASCACMAVETASSTCENALLFAPSTAPCYAETASFADAFQQYAALFCGDGSLDGG